MQKRQNKHPDPTPWLFLAPSLCGVTLFVLAPFVETVRRSVTDTMGRHFVGLANYTAVLGNDAFRLAVENTVRFIGVCVPLLLALSLALALALRAKGLKNTSWAEVCRTTFLLPMALPVASLALLWKVLFAQNGLVNGTFGTHCDFMGTDAAFWVLVGTYLWKNIGYDSILWSSGLDSISTDLYEAAAVDGASGWRQFTAITLPNLLPTLAVTLVLSLLNTFKVFREAYLVAGAYPEKSIYLLQHLFNNWFLALDRLGGAGSDHRPGAFRQRAGCVDPAAQLPYAGTCCQAAAGHTGILYHLLEHLPADISAVGWSIGRGCSRRMGTLPLEISRARGRAGAVPYFNVAAVPGHYGACLSDDKPPGTDGYCLGGHSAGGIQHISRICDAARV